MLSERIDLTASISRSARVPDLLELYGDNGAFRGSADLLPETGVQGDLGLRWVQGETTAELVCFAGRTWNTIVWLPNAQGVALATNLDGARRDGIEAGSSGQLDLFSWQGSLTAMRTPQLSDRAANDGRPLPGIPAWEWHHRVGPVLGPIEFGHRLDASAPTGLDAVGVSRTGARWIHSMWSSAAFGRFVLEAEVLNLLDQRTEVGARDALVNDGQLATRALVDMAGYPLPGRMVLVALSVRL
jgi:outer membrane receptor protein involved in Fe transport